MQWKPPSARRMTDCLAGYMFTFEYLICEVQTISAAEYSTWRNATWQHTSKAEAVWRRGCDAILCKSHNISCKLWKSHRKQWRLCKTRHIHFVNKRRRRNIAVSIERKVQVADFTAHSGEEAWHATRPASCAPILWRPSSARRRPTFPSNTDSAQWDQLGRARFESEKHPAFNTKGQPSPASRVIWSLLFVIPQSRHCNSPATTCAPSSQRRLLESRFLHYFVSPNHNSHISRLS